MKPLAPGPAPDRRGRTLGQLALLALLAAVGGGFVQGGGGVEGAGDEAQALRRRVAELEAELARERAERAALEGELRAQVALLRRELAAATEVRLAREREWLSYTRLFAELSPAGLPAGLLFRPELPEEELEFLLLETPSPAEPAPGRSERDREVFLALRSLLALEGIDGLELLESGRVAAGATGPVVLRWLDERGRSTGSLAAERLRLEGSRAARSLTLVLEEGYERSGGRRRAFEGAPEGAERGGVRRIHLGRVDPAPWIRALPELFRPADREPPLDDGRWDLVGLRLTLNELLDRETLGSTWRLRALGGVAGAELRDVLLEQREGGATQRQLVADRLRIQVDGAGILLLLEDGAQLAQGKKFPFLDGRYRIYLPRADAAAWRAAGLPGLVADPPAAPSAPAPRLR